jgi:hypothetical protein
MPGQGGCFVLENNLNSATIKASELPGRAA